MSRRHTIALSVLTAALGASTFANAMQHDMHKAHVALHPRQDVLTSDLLGSSAPPPPPPASANLPEITFTIVPIPADSTAIPTIGQSSISNSNGSAGAPSFPTMTVQEAVATVCPNATGGEGLMFTILPLAFPSGAETINVTAPLPNGSSTVFSSGVTATFSATVNAAADATAARVVQGEHGCQTLYTPTVKAFCSTTISPLGIPEVIVTDCEQWVTFSSETKVCSTVSVPARNAVPLPSVVVAAGGEGGEGVANAPKRQAAGEEGQAEAIATATPAVDSAVDPALLIPLPTASPSRGPGTYYAVLWYDAARGGVPPRVRVVECRDDDVVGDGGGGGCTTWEERWSVSEVVRTLTKTSRVTYSGPVVVTDGTNTYTTTISIATVTTATRVTVSPSVIKRRLLQAGQDAGTVRMTVTLTETEYSGVTTNVVAGGGVRTVELVQGAGASAVV